MLFAISLVFSCFDTLICTPSSSSSSFWSTYRSAWHLFVFFCTVYQPYSCPYRASDDLFLSAKCLFYFERKTSRGRAKSWKRIVLSGLSLPEFNRETWSILRTKTSRNKIREELLFLKRCFLKVKYPKFFRLIRCSTLTWAHPGSQCASTLFAFRCLWYDLFVRDAFLYIHPQTFRIQNLSQIRPESNVYIFHHWFMGSTLHDE